MSNEIAQILTDRQLKIVSLIVMNIINSDKNRKCKESEKNIKEILDTLNTRISTGAKPDKSVLEYNETPLYIEKAIFHECLMWALNGDFNVKFSAFLAPEIDVSDDEAVEIEDESEVEIIVEGRNICKEIITTISPGVSEKDIDEINMEAVSCDSCHYLISIVMSILESLYIESPSAYPMMEYDIKKLMEINESFYKQEEALSCCVSVGNLQY